MKKIKYSLVLSIFVIIGFAFTSGDTDKAALKKWEATPEGVKFKKWEVSSAGKKVFAAEAKIRKSIKEFTNMEGVVTALKLPVGSRLGFGVMVKLNGEDFILSFGPESNNEFKLLHRLKVHDKIIIRSSGVSHAPKYAYPIIGGDHIEKDGKLLFKRVPRKGGC